MSKITRNQVVAEYERQEAAAGGLAAADLDEVAEATARALDMTSIEVKRIMLDHWCMLGVG